MFGSQIFKVVLRISILTIFIVSLRFFSSEAKQDSPQSQERIPVAVKQLQSEAGIIPVEMRCGFAQHPAPNRLGGFSCTLKNNTNSSITAAYLFYSVLLENDGVVRSDTHALTIDTLVSPDFADSSHPIAEGAEWTMGPVANISYGTSVIKGVEIELDYVELENGAPLGPDKEGSRILSDMREGARKYKNWLAKKYVNQGKSEDALKPLLQSDRPLPSVADGLEFKNSEEENGAKAYRTRLRRLSDSQGMVEAAKHLTRQ